jgi:hypothetical protein
MAVKLGRKALPSGLGPNDFKYVGRPAIDQDDFESAVGLADMACVNQHGDANNSKGYHGGVVQSTDGRWWCYFEWGRIKPGKSWNGVFLQQDFQFVQCSSEAEARSEFAKQMKSKNIKRLRQIPIAGTTIWAGKPGKDGYIVQALATRERGLPDAYTIKDDSGVQAAPAPKAAPKKAAKGKPSRNYQPQVIALAQSLVGGTQSYARSLSEASGIKLTMGAITKVRDELLPAALQCQKDVNDKLGSNATQEQQIAAQVKDANLGAVSRMVFAMVPQPISRSGISDEDATLTQGRVLKIQQDLDAFESALGNEDFSVEVKDNTIDPDKMLNAKLTWIEPNSELGRFVANTYRAMTNNRHGDVRGRKLRILNMFEMERPDRDQNFARAVKALAAKRTAATNGRTPAGLQPPKRIDLGDLGDFAADANIFLGIHGTRGVNVAPIMQTHLRMPKSLAGVHITGAAFGHGIYFATDLAKSWGYTGHGNRWGGGGGSLSGRGAFMFLADVAGGQFHYPNRAWGINGDRCPGGADSVYAHPNHISSLANDEHVIFDANACRLRYLVEMDFS